MKRTVKLSKLIPLVGLCLLCSCHKDPVDFYFEDSKVYFDMDGFIRGQIVNLKGRSFGLRMKEEKDGFVRTIEKDEVDWEVELREFLECDINKPAWRDGFTVDTVLRNETTLVIKYQAREAECPVNNVVVTFDRATATCLKVSVEKSTNNFLYTSHKKLFFNTGEGYMVKSHLKINYLFTSEYAVESRFIEM